MNKNREKSSLLTTQLATNIVENLWDGTSISGNTFASRAGLLVYYVQYISWIYRSDEKDLLIREGFTGTLGDFVRYFTIIPFLANVDTIIVYLVSVAMIAINSGIILYLVGFPIIKLYVGRKQTEKNIAQAFDNAPNPWLMFFRRGLNVYFGFYICVIFSPLLELYLNLFTYCEDDRSLLIDQRTKGSCGSVFLPRIIIGIIGIITSLGIMVLSLWGFRSFDFLERNPLRNRAGSLRIIVLLGRIIIVFLFVAISREKEASITLIAVNICVVAEAAEFSLEFKTYNRLLFALHAQLIAISLGLTWTWTFIKGFNRSSQLEYLVFSFLATAIAIKFGERFAFWLFTTNILGIPMQDNKDVDILKQKNFDYVLELIMMSVMKNKAFISEESYQADQMDVLGFMIQHMRLCKNPSCWFRRGKLDEFVMKQDEDKKQLFIQVCNFFFNLYLNPKGNGVPSFEAKRKDSNYERIVLKFFSFMAFENNNPTHSFYYICKIQKHLAHQESSLFFKVTSKMLQDMVRRRQSAYDSSQREIAIKSGISAGRELDVAGMELLMKNDEKYRAALIDMISLKQRYLECLKNGCSSSDQLINLFVSLQRKYKSFRSLIKEAEASRSSTELKWKLAVSTKFHSIYNCILTNCVNLAIKFEEEIIKIMTYDNLIEREFLSLKNFMTGNMIVIEASFTGHTGGMLLEHSKGKKFISFFDLAPEHANKMESITDLMPGNIKNVHGKFISNFINQERSINTKEKKSLAGFCTDSKDFLFPVKVYPRINLDSRQDFQMTAAILKLENNKRFIVVDTKGLIIGINKKMSKIFAKGCGNKEESSGIFRNINIFMLMPQLNELIKKKLKNVAEKDSSSMNQLAINSDFFLPRNMDMFLEELESRRVSHSSGRQKSEFYSISNTIRASSYRTKNPTSRSMTIQQSEVAYYEELMDPEKSFLFSVVFNLNYFVHSWGKEAEEKVEYFQIEIERLRKASQQMLESIRKKSQKRLNSDVGSFNKEQSLNISQDLVAMQENHEKIGDMPSMNTARLLQPPTSTARNEHLDLQSALVEIQNSGERAGPSNENVSKKSPQQASEVMPVIEEQDSIDTDDSKLGENKDRNLESRSASENMSNLQRNTETVKNIQKHASVQGSSLNSSSRSSNVIYSVLYQLQSYRPSALIKLAACLLGDIIMILVYSIVLYVLSDQYISNEFIPLRSSLGNFGEMTNSLSFAMVGTFELKLQANFSADYDARPLARDLLNRTITSEFRSLKTNYYIESNTLQSNLMDYQKKFKGALMERTNIFTNELEKRLGEEYISDNILYLYNTFIGYKMAENQFLMPIRDLLEGMRYMHSIKESLQDQFQATADHQLTAILTMFIAFSIGSIVIRVVAIFLIGRFYEVVLKVLKLFLRINEDDIQTEQEILRETLKILQRTDNYYFNTSFPAFYVSFDQKGLPSKPSQSSRHFKSLGEDTKASEKKKKKRNVYTIDPPTKTRIYIGFLLNLILIFFFFAVIYFLWNSIDTNIDQLVQTNIFLAEIVILPNTLLASTALLLNELFYGRSDKFPQIVENHKTYLNRYHALTSNIESFIFIENSQKDYETIMKGNICEVLVYEKPEDKDTCQTVLDGSFKKGLIYVLASLENVLSLDEFFDSEAGTLIQSIEKFIQSDNHFHSVQASYFLDMALTIYKKHAEGFFSEQLLQQIETFKQVLIALCVLFLLTEFLLTRLLLQDLIGLFSHMMSSLYLIPFNSLFKDEKLRNLIKQVNTK